MNDYEETARTLPLDVLEKELNRRKCFSFEDVQGVTWRLWATDRESFCIGGGGAAIDIGQSELRRIFNWLKLHFEPEKRPVCNHESTDGETIYCAISDLTKQMADLHKNSVMLGPVIEPSELKYTHIYAFEYMDERLVGCGHNDGDLLRHSVIYPVMSCRNIREVLIR